MPTRKELRDKRNEKAQQRRDQERIADQQRQQRKIMKKFQHDAKQREKHTAREEQRIIRDGSKAEKQYIDQLKRDMAIVDSNYMSYIDKSVQFDVNKKQMRAYTASGNEVYHRNMINTCISPLANGVRPSTVLQAIGMYTGMCLTNRDFREHSHDLLRDKLYGAVQKKAESKGPNSFWAKRRDRMLDEKLMRENGGRLPFTPKSAALQKLAMTRRVYADMRTDGLTQTDIGNINEEYQAAMAIIDSQCVADGLNVDDVNRQMRTMVGYLAKSDPSILPVFSEFANGAVKADAHPDPNDPDHNVWTGEYNNADGTEITSQFTPRQPKSVDTHANELVTDIENMLTNAESADSIKNMIEGYNSALEYSDGKYPKNIDPAVKPYYDKAFMQYKMMEDDGVELDDFKAILNKTFVHMGPNAGDKWSDFKKDYPDLYNDVCIMAEVPSVSVEIDPNSPSAERSVESYAVKDSNKNSKTYESNADFSETKSANKTPVMTLTKEYADGSKLTMSFDYASAMGVNTANATTPNLFNDQAYVQSVLDKFNKAFDGMEKADAAKAAAAAVKTETTVEKKERRMPSFMVEHEGEFNNQFGIPGYGRDNNDMSK